MPKINKKRNKMNFFDTIAAISTPIGKGGVAVIRISGAEAVEIAEKAFRTASGKSISELVPNRMVYGQIISEGKAIDDGLCVKFCAPRSFTGEDTVEINCHGGAYITQKVLSAVLAAGARAAEAGEFTRRAFVNGKMALSQAEALGTLLEAKNDGQIALSRSAMGGKIKDACDAIYSRMLSLVSQVYACVDYPEEELAELGTDEMITLAREIERDIDRLARTYKTGHAVIEGVRTVICGKPNVGKSSLYNCLVGREAAIVTDIEGTTRDVLSESITLGKVTLRLYDTAGLRETEDKVEKIGVERARASLEEAELVLAVFDNSRPLDEQDRELMDDIKMINAAKIAVINKNDKNSMISESEIEANFDKIVKLSAKNEYNVEELVKLIESMYINEEIDIDNGAVIINARQNAALVAAKEHLELAVTALENGLPPDLAGVDVELAMARLAQLDGREVGEDVVSEIFSHFCVGK